MKDLDKSTNEFHKDIEIVVIKYFQDPPLAQLYVASLAEKGIDSFLSNTNMNNTLGVDFSNMGLHINKLDLTKAKSIIEGLDLEFASNNPDFSIDEASEVDIALEKGLLAKEQQKQDNTFYLLIGLILLGGVIAAIYNYWLLN